MTDRIVEKHRSKQKLVLFLDEIQWMAAGRGKLISLLKYYWDNRWKKKKIMLILCGSIASFMVRKVIRSKALYGRITVELLLKGLLPHEAAQLFEGRRSHEEILKYLLVFGGVPKYLEEVNLHHSFSQNMNRLCFSQSGALAHEVDRIFYSQLRESKTYQRMVTLLKDRMRSFDEIAKNLRLASGGGLKTYIDNLEQAEIIRSFVPFDRPIKSKLKRYKLADEYLLFFFEYMEPNLETINESGSKRLFERLTGNGIETWFGFAFEHLCLKQASYLAEIMGFEEEVLRASPYFERGDTQFQIDLLYRRADKVITLCEIKHHNRTIDTKVIPEVEGKCSRFKPPRGYSIEKALISLYGPNDALRDSQYFDRYVVLKNILFR